MVKPMAKSQCFMVNPACFAVFHHHFDGVKSQTFRKKLHHSLAEYAKKIQHVLLKNSWLQEITIHVWWLHWLYNIDNNPLKSSKIHSDPFKNGSSRLSRPIFRQKPHGIRPSASGLAEFHVFLLRLVAGPWSLGVLRGSCGIKRKSLLRWTSYALKLLKNAVDGCEILHQLIDGLFMFINPILFIGWKNHLLF